MLANTIEPPAFDITVFSPNYVQRRPLGSYVRAKFQWHWNLPATATIELKADHPMIAYLVDCMRKVIPIRTSYNGVVWDGRIMTANVKGKPGEETYTFTCVNNLFWLLRCLAWVNPLFPPEVQVGLTGKQDIMFGSVDFVLKYFLAKNFTRQQKPVYMSTPLHDNTFDHPNKDLDKIDDLDDLLAIIADTDLVAASARFTQLDELYKQIVESTGVGLEMKLWVKGDTPKSPSVFNTDTLSRLQNILDRSGDNFFWFTNANNVLGLADPNTWGTITKQAGYVFDTKSKRNRRHMQWRTDAGQIVEYERQVEHATAHTAIVGGKAPAIMNQLVEWGANLAIQAIASILIPGFGGVLVGNLFDDILFAYQEFTNDDLIDEGDGGDFGEHFFGEIFADNTAAWSVDGYTTAKQALTDNGGTDTVKMTVVSGGPDGRGFSFGVDDGSGKRFLHGDIMTFWDRGTTVENYVSAVEVEDSRNEKCTETITLGDDRALKDGWGKVIDRLKTFGALSRGQANN